MLNVFGLSIKLERFYFGIKWAFRYSVMDAFIFMKKLLLLVSLSLIVCCNLSYVMSLHSWKKKKKQQPRLTVNTYKYLVTVAYGIIFWRRKH